MDHRWVGVGLISLIQEKPNLFLSGYFPKVLAYSLSYVPETFAYIHASVTDSPTRAADELSECYSHIVVIMTNRRLVYASDE